MITFEQFLEKASSIKQTARYVRLHAFHEEYEGEQFESRELDISGYRRSSPGVPGSATHSPSFERRHPGAVWNLRREVVETITDWTLGGDSWCTLETPGDEDAQKALAAIAKESNLADVMEEARNIGGAEGSVGVSYAFRNGTVSLETHHPFQTWVLAWANEATREPADVVELYVEDDPFAPEKQDGRDVLVVRRWTATEESIHKRVWSASRGEYIWIVADVVPHGLGRCPFVWYAQGKCDPGKHDGEPDGEGTGQLIADANLLFSAGSVTTKRNADDTLVIREDPSLNTGKVKKGGFNTIFARGGAEILSQSGDSARICVELADRRAEQVHRASRVVVPRMEDLGRATTGEALKRLFQPLIKIATKHRRGYARGLIVPLCRALLAACRTLSTNFRLELFGDDGEAITSFGASMNVECTWPDPVPPTTQDTATILTALSTATGGKQVLSQRTALRMLSAMAIVPVADVDEELEQIDKEASAATERAMALASELGAGGGKAGPVGDGEPPPPPAKAET